MSTEQQSMHILDSYLKLLNTLDCPVCFEYLQTPIYQCVAGHVLCHKCILTVKDCPTCRGIIDASSRARSLEYVSDVMLVPCRNDGCSMALPIKDIKSHEQDCHFPKLNENEKQRAIENNLLLHVEEYVSPFFVSKPSTTFASQECQTINSSAECVFEDPVERILSTTFSKKRQSYKFRKIKGLKNRMDIDFNETTDDRVVIHKMSHKYALMKKKIYPNQSAESEAGGEENNNSDNDVILFSNIWNKPSVRVNWSL